MGRTEFNCKYIIYLSIKILFIIICYLLIFLLFTHLFFHLIEVSYIIKIQCNNNLQFKIRRLDHYLRCLSIIIKMQTTYKIKHFGHFYLLGWGPDRLEARFWSPSISLSHCQGRWPTEQNCLSVKNILTVSYFSRARTGLRRMPFRRAAAQTARALPGSAASQGSSPPFVGWSQGRPGYTQDSSSYSGYNR